MLVHDFHVDAHVVFDNISKINDSSAFPSMSKKIIDSNNALQLRFPPLNLFQR